MNRKIKVDVRIDKFNLEEELAVQPDLFYYWSAKASEAKAERDRCKNKVAKLEAGLTVKIYTGKYPLPVDDKGKAIKITVDTGKALVASDPDVIEAKEELAEAEKAYNKAASAEEAMQQKRSSLKHLTELYINEYYSQTGANTGVKVSKTDQKSKSQAKALNKNRGK